MKKNKLERQDWRDYELQILKYFRENFPNKIVLDNQKHLGRHSEKQRQIDVAIYNKSDSTKLHCIVECKYFNKIITLPYIDSLFGKLDDIGISKGVIVTTKGFSSGVENYASKKKIELRTIDYEYLKDYYYIPPSSIPDVFLKSVHYFSPYCKNCDLTILYEIGEVRGFAAYEDLNCPKCKHFLHEVRSDANHRVIKLFKGMKISPNLINEIKAKHIFITRNEWQQLEYLHNIITKPNINTTCFLCKNEFIDNPPTRLKCNYKGKNVCSECMNSERTLLIDYNFSASF
ncbi:MAG: hypothetical protein C0448_12020 [Sphingobacteriaceae bacterium]|nr:hypothetical protein [Sphingobacteriaceae bacterium]